MKSFAPVLATTKTKRNSKRDGSILSKSDQALKIWCYQNREMGVPADRGFLVN